MTDPLDKQSINKLRLVAKQVMSKQERAKLIDKIKPLEQYKAAAQRLCGDIRIDKTIRHEMSDLIEAGVFDKEREVINRKVENELDKRIEGRVRVMIERGELPDPKTIHNKYKNDPLTQRHLK